MNHNRVVWWPVSFQVAADDGVVQDYRVEVKLRLMSRSEMREALRDSLPGDGATAATLLQTMDPEALSRRDQRLADHVSDWRNIGLESGEPVPFTRENLLAVMDAVPSFTIALDTMLWRVSMGQFDEK